jgi:hypothetical protein
MNKATKTTIILALCLNLCGCLDSEIPITKDTAARINDCLSSGLEADVFRNLESNKDPRDNVTVHCHVNKFFGYGMTTPDLVR